MPSHKIYIPMSRQFPQDHIHSLATAIVRGATEKGVPSSTWNERNSITPHTLFHTRCVKLM